MDKTRLSANLNLIKTLLTCPQGEEWVYLKYYEKIVDAEFLQFMEQVALQLGQQGDQASAAFLHNWAAKLHHIWLKEIDPAAPEEDKTEAYLSLIQQLLDCPKEMEEHLLIAHETLIGPGLVHKMQEVSKQLKQQGEAEPAAYLESIANELSQSWLVEHDFSARLEKPSTQSTSPQSTSQSVPQFKHQAKNKSSTSAASPEDHALGDLSDDLSDDVWFDAEDSRFGAIRSVISSPTQPLVNSTQPKQGVVTSLSDSPQLSDYETTVNRAISSGAIASASASERLTQAVRQSPIQPAAQQAIAQSLQAIADALEQLNQTMTTVRSPHPLSYLEVLEKAYAASWQLTTEEIKQLLGVTPRCQARETVYRRGEWCFTKVGKVGRQTAWKVTKEQN